MKKVTILGWYGTETIGDRAIMAGIFNLFSLGFEENFIIYWGSLFPPLTERSLFEDHKIYDDISNNKIRSIDVFYSLSKSELEKKINDSDFVIIGGGPLDDIQAMYMLKYAFRYAKKKNKKTSIFGCGWGSLKNESLCNVALDIVSNSDLTIFRDDMSVNECKKYINTEKKLIGLIDPAVFCAQYFRNLHLKKQDNVVSINFRELFVKEHKEKGFFQLNDCVNILDQIIKLHLDVPIKMIPMHTFYIGGDDRVLLNKIKDFIDCDNLIVQNRPLSLFETMEVYYNSLFCVGMRFHAVLLQSILNGKNFIMDYTSSNNGKIKALLNQLDISASYENRYVDCNNIKGIYINPEVPKINIIDDTIDSYKCLYVKSLKEVFS